MPVPGVVLHLTEASADKHRAVLRNALNLLPELTPRTPIEVVVHSDAIVLAVPGQEATDALMQALGAGIVLVACRNSMRPRGLTEDELVGGTVAVSSGVGHLVARQARGWAHLRPSRSRCTSSADTEKLRVDAARPCSRAVGS